MTRFLSDLVIRALAPSELKARGLSKQNYSLVADLAYESDAFGPIVIPAGTVTDFASVPRIAYTYISPESPAILYASVVHDYLYGVHGKLPLRRLTRAECDWVLREAMLICGARPTQAWLVYKAVRLFGGSHWKDLTT